MSDKAKKISISTRYLQNKFSDFTVLDKVHSIGADAFDEVSYNGVYNCEIDLRHFGEDFCVEEAAFCVKVMKNMLGKRL